MAAFLGFIVQSLPVVSGEHWFAPYRGYVAGVSPQEQWDNVPAIGKLQILVAIGMLESYGEGAGNPEGYVHYCNGLCSGVYFFQKRGDGTSMASRRQRLTLSLRRRPPRLLPADRRPRRLRPGWLQPLRPLQLVRLGLPGQGQGADSAFYSNFSSRSRRDDVYAPPWHRQTVSFLSQARGRQVEINNGRAAMLGIFMMLSESAVPGAVPPLTLINYIVDASGLTELNWPSLDLPVIGQVGGWAFLNSFPQYTPSDDLSIVTALSQFSTPGNALNP